MTLQPARAAAERIGQQLAHYLAQIRPHEKRAVALAFACHFVLFSSYYILRPVRDGMATVFGVDQLQNLYTGTLIFTLLCSPIYAWLTDTFKLSRVIPGVFWFWFLNILLFYFLFNTYPESRWISAAFYWWFSVVNLFMISVFWSLMVDLFSASQATRLFGLIASGASIGAILGPILTRMWVQRIGIDGMLLVAAAGFLIAIVLVHMLMRTKKQLQQASDEAQSSTLDHQLEGTLWDGFKTIFQSRYLLLQTVFFLLMTWIATIAYFTQTDLVARTFSDIETRTRALADIDLVVNICSAAVLIFGLSRFVTRFGLTTGLAINPVLMIFSFICVALAPTLLMMQAMQTLRRVSQYAIVRPCREMCFTVVPQESRYKAKNVIDTVIYRLGDLTAAWVQAGLRMLGFGSTGGLWLGLLVSGLWGAAAIAVGRRYEQLRQTGLLQTDKSP